jgi:transcriptional regulator with PAS, ATPase and Fis domain
VVSISPIRLEEKIDGAIMTLQEGRKVMEMSSELRHELYIRGQMARWRFEHLPAQSEAGARMVKQAARVAQFQAPLLLTGEFGSGKEILAQCIHNAGVTRGNAFISLDCRAYQSETLDTLLFGTVSARKDSLPSLVEAAQDGTIFLSNIEFLSEELQYKIHRLTRGIFLHNGSNKPMEVSVRLIAATHTPLITKVENGSFRSDLYYAINALGITVPPIRRRREDILGWIDIYLREWKKRYDRVIHLTQGAKDYLTGYDWPGNLNQINSVCEQMMLLSERRNIDEGFLRRQIEQLTPKTLPGTAVRRELVIGQGWRGKNPDALDVGNCCLGAAACVKGCPPTAADVLKALRAGGR